jgi:hypothetical protein
MMTREEALAHVGETVIYQSEAQREGRDKRPPERGVITSVGRDWVFVAYGRSMTSAGTSPDDLTLEAEATVGERYPHVAAAIGGDDAVHG